MAGVEVNSEDDATIKFFASPTFAYFTFLVLGLVTVLIVSVTLRDFSDSETSLMELAYSCFAVALFGILTVIALGRALRLRGAVLEIGPQGILDRRLSDRLIPWSAISDVSTHQVWVPLLGSDPAQRYLIVRLDPVFESGWIASPSALMNKVLGPRSGWKGQTIGVLDLNGGSFEDLEQAVAKFREQSKLSLPPSR